MTFQKPKGTKDFFPEEWAVHMSLANSFIKTATSYGYKEIETPAFESFDLLSAKSGKEIEDQLFMLKKKGDEVFALKPEYTASVARMFIEKQKEIPKPVKWFYTGRMWRYEQPQKGRLREFYQLGVELFGSNQAIADAEVISLAIDFFKSLGLTKKDFKVKINNRKILQGIIQEIVGKKKIADAFKVIDKKRKLTDSQFKAECEELGIEKVISLLHAKSADELEELKLNELATEGVEELRKVIALLDKEFVEIDMTIVRGLGYYTGTVFEIYDIEEKLRSLCGGGRYDEMVSGFGGESCPATGFGIGMEPLTVYLTELGKLPKIELSPDYFVAPVNEAMIPKAKEIASKLRKNHSVEMEIMGRGLGKQLSSASTLKAKKVVIVGEKDLAEGKVTVRDLVSGKEEKVDFNKLV